MNGYKINYTQNTLTMNYTFAKKANVYKSPEYTILKSIREDYPHIQIIVASGRKKKNGSKTQKYKNLTYKHMYEYMKAKEAWKSIVHFDTVKRESLTQPSPYKYVVDWFLEEFPELQKDTVIDIFNDDTMAHVENVA